MAFTPRRLNFVLAGLKFDLDLSARVFERLGVQIFVLLAWFLVNGTDKCTNFSAVQKFVQYRLK